MRDEEKKLIDLVKQANSDEIFSAVIRTMNNIANNFQSVNWEYASKEALVTMGKLSYEYVTR